MMPTEQKLINMAYELACVYAQEAGHDTSAGLPVGYLTSALSCVFAIEARITYNPDFMP